MGHEQNGPTSSVQRPRRTGSSICARPTSASGRLILALPFQHLDTQPPPLSKSSTRPFRNSGTKGQGAHRPGYRAGISVPGDSGIRAIGELGDRTTEQSHNGTTGQPGDRTIGRPGSTRAAARWSTRTIGARTIGARGSGLRAQGSGHTGTRAHGRTGTRVHGYRGSNARAHRNAETRERGPTASPAPWDAVNWSHEYLGIRAL